MGDTDAVLPERADYLIIGGGTGGCVMAARLSANPAVRVVLVEAGADFAENGLPELARDPSLRTLSTPDYFWPNVSLDGPGATPEAQQAHRKMTLLARTVGGGSFVNGMQAARGLARDYDEWSAFGVRGWSGEDVWHYFKKVENDLDYSGPDHGRSGPIEIQRIPDDRWSGFSLAVRSFFESRGVPRTNDFNDSVTRDAVGPVSLNFGKGGRMSTANAYLTQEVRRRPNLSIVSKTTAARIVFEGTQATGAMLQGGGGEYRVDARNVVLACGAINSPALLQRSGVGPAERLQAAAIQVVADRPGVGQNFRSHLLVSLNVHLRRAGRVRGPKYAPCPMVVRYSSHEPGCPESDMFIYVWERSLGSLKSDPMGRQFGSLMSQLSKTFSVGEVNIRPQDPNALPHIRSNMLSDPRDRRRAIAGFLTLLDFLKSPYAPHVVNEAFLLKRVALLRKVMQNSTEAKILSELGNVALGGPQLIRRSILGRLATFLEDMDRGSGIEQFIERNASTTHEAGTCRMGEESDPQAVTDSRGRVIGVEGLRIADASIFPTMMSGGGTNLPVMMAAEKIAEMVVEDNR